MKFGKITKFGAVLAFASTSNLAFADTVSCLSDCQVAYEACLKSPATITTCLNRLKACKGNCAAEPD